MNFSRVASSLHQLLNHQSTGNLQLDQSTRKLSATDWCLSLEKSHLWQRWRSGTSSVSNKPPPPSFCTSAPITRTQTAAAHFAQHHSLLT